MLRGSNFALIWSPVVCSLNPFRAMCYPVNMYCDRDISCIVIVTYHVLISIQLVSYVVSIQCKLVSLHLGSRDKETISCLYCYFYFGPMAYGLGLRA